MFRGPLELSFFLFGFVQHVLFSFQLELVIEHFLDILQVLDPGCSFLWASEVSPDLPSN